MVRTSLLLIVLLLAGYAAAGGEGPASVEAMREAAVPGQMTEVISAEPVTVPETEMFNFFSTVADREYRIYVTLPQGRSPKAANGPRCPVVYLLDANWFFPMTTGISRQLNLGGELDSVIIVGIGYPTDDTRELMALRVWDFLPTDIGTGGGGGEAFLGFIQEELIPYINANYRTIPGDRTLAGHSYGGLFTLYALFNATETFQRYIAMSPALFYDDMLVFGYEEAYAAEHDGLPVELFLSVGEFEPDVDPLWMVSNLVDFHQILVEREYAGLEMEMVIMDRVGHTGSVPGSITRGLLAVFH